MKPIAIHYVSIEQTKDFAALEKNLINKIRVATVYYFVHLAAPIAAASLGLFYALLSFEALWILFGVQVLFWLLMGVPSFLITQTDPIRRDIGFLCAYYVGAIFWSGMLFIAPGAILWGIFAGISITLFS